MLRKLVRPSAGDVKGFDWRSGGRMVPEICRICGRDADLRHILEGGKELQDMLLLCANIKIDVSDALPKHICQECERSLEVSYRLRKQSEATEERLRREMQPPKQEVPELANLSDVNEDDLEFIECDRESPQQYVAESKNEDIVEISNECDNEENCVGEAIGKICDAEDDADENGAAIEHYSIDLVTEGGSSGMDVIEETAEKDQGVRMNVYVCGTCQQVFALRTDYRAHIKEHGNKRFQCVRCSKWFPSQYRLKKHGRCHRNVEMYKCSLCDRSYRFRYNLVRHMRAAHEQHREFKCELCDEAFGRADILKNHMTTHVEGKDFQCEHCHVSFKSKRYLESHVKTHLSKDLLVAKPRTKDSSNHSSKKTYYCIHCGKISKHHFTHKNHLRTHSEERPYTCETCGKKFRTMAALITHDRIHSDLRPYQCDLCLISFRQQSHLKEHKMIHDGIMPHVCHICQMAFIKKSNLQAHMRVHTGERPFKCAECIQQFSKLSLLKRHASVVHGRVVDTKNGQILEATELEQSDDKENGEEGEENAMEKLEDNENIDLDVGAYATSYFPNDINDLQQDSTCGTSRLLCPRAISNDLDVNIDDEEACSELVIGDDSKFSSLYIMDDLLNNK